jgi:EpsI family protein
MRIRLIVAGAFLTAAGVAARGVDHGEPIKLIKPLSHFPDSLGAWKGRTFRLTNRIETRVGVSDYLYRIYLRPPDSVAHFYVGYYESQRHGEMIHSPKNCLPGTGWYIARRSAAALSLTPYAPFEVNHFIVENGLERQVVLYWYLQAGDRIVTNEYLGRAQLVWDALTRNRTDAALVRVSVPFEQSEARAFKTAVEFLREAYPRLMELLPRGNLKRAS